MNKKGDVLILVIGLLALFLIATVTYLMLGRTGAKIATFNLQEVKAKEMAETGVAEAVLRLKSDDQSIDHYGELWHGDFIGDEVDNDADRLADSRWLLVKKGDRIIGRYAVLVEDESAKINLNAAGNISRNGYQGIGEGWKVNEISLLALPGINPEIARKTCLERYGANGLPGGGSDDDLDNFSLVVDGIDNDGDGFIDEPGEGVNEPDEFTDAKPRGDDRPFLSPEDFKEVSGVGPEIYEKVKNLIAIFSYDKNLDFNGEPRLNLNQASIIGIKEGLRRSGFTNESQVCQMAVNIRDYQDSDSLPSKDVDSKGNIYYGLEKTPYFNEMEAAPDLEEKWNATVLTFWWSKGEFLELFNPYSQSILIGGWKIDIGNFFSVTLKKDAQIPGGGYYTIGDRLAFWISINFATWPPEVVIIPVLDSTPKGCDQYEEFIGLPILGSELSLFDEKGNTIEATNYGPDFYGKATKQKNDPRMGGLFDWFPGPASPGKQNALFLPEIGLEVNRLNWSGHFLIKNKPFSQVGELGNIHQMREWRTINLWREGNFDLKTQDIFTVSDPTELPVPGRININTAPLPVLTALPFIGIAEAGKIIAGRPYSEIGAVAPKLNFLWGYNLKDDDNDGFIDEDDERELAYRRISNLITVRSNVFRVTVTGQTVEDFNGNGKIEEKEVQAEKKITAIYDRGRKHRKFLSWKIE
ncbi:MAG: type II secretion system protein GspK [Candidatus Omnitrophica bacterium]|nr:type II secretion system protein GspK [Candidatus Omnitrophota bacterium]